jgi:hypothetical protein
VFTLSRREQRHGFGKEVGRAIIPFEDRHRLRRSTDSAAAAFCGFRISNQEFSIIWTPAFTAGSSAALIPELAGD